jgi:hypothetical protein
LKLFKPAPVIEEVPPAKVAVPEQAKDPVPVKFPVILKLEFALRVAPLPMFKVVKLKSALVVSRLLAEITTGPNKVEPLPDSVQVAPPNVVLPEDAEKLIVPLFVSVPFTPQATVPVALNEPVTVTLLNILVAVPDNTVVPLKTIVPPLCVNVLVPFVIERLPAIPNVFEGAVNELFALIVTAFRFTVPPFVSVLFPPNVTVPVPVLTVAPAPIV